MIKKKSSLLGCATMAIWKIVGNIMVDLVAFNCRAQSNPEFGGDKLLCNVGNCLVSDIMLYFRKFSYSFLLIFLRMNREIIIQACIRRIAYLNFL
jgi:hypothetical protein